MSGAAVGSIAMEAPPHRLPIAAGSVHLDRVGRVGFPIEALVDESGLIVYLGRDSSISIFFGRGRRVRFEGGTEWRIKAITSGRHIVPVVKSQEGTIAVTGPLYARRSYGINGKGYGFTLIPLGRIGLLRPGSWALQHQATQIATVDDGDRVMHATVPIPLAAVLLTFTLVTHGIPGEADLMPSRE